MTNLSPLTRTEYAQITKVMDGREFVIIHRREGDGAYSNSPLGDEMKPLLIRAALHLANGGTITPVPHEEEDDWKNLI